MVTSLLVVQSAAIFQLHEDPCLKILSHLSGTDLASMAKTCKVWSRLCAEALSTRYELLSLKSIAQTFIEFEPALKATAQMRKQCCYYYDAPPFPPVALADLMGNTGDQKKSPAERLKACVELLGTPRGYTHAVDALAELALTTSMRNNRPDQVRALLKSEARLCIQPSTVDTEISHFAEHCQYACLSHLLKHQEMRRKDDQYREVFASPLYSLEPSHAQIKDDLFTALQHNHLDDCTTLLLERCQAREGHFLLKHDFQKAQQDCPGRYPPQAIAWLQEKMESKK